MPDTKISALTELTGTPPDADVVPIVDSATTKKIQIVNLLSGMVPKSVVTLLGDLIYGTGSATVDKLPGNITATRKFLRQLGNGSISAAPGWDTIVAGDIAAAIDLTPSVVSLGADITGVPASFTDVLTVALDAGTWEVIAQITASNTSADNMDAKLDDGTTTRASGTQLVPAGGYCSMSITAQFTFASTTTVHLRAKSTIGSMVVRWKSYATELGATRLHVKKVKS